MTKSLSEVAKQLENDETLQAKTIESSVLVEFARSAYENGPLRAYKGAAQGLGAEVGSITPYSVPENVSTATAVARGLGHATGTIFNLALEGAAVRYAGKLGLRSAGRTEEQALVKMMSPAARLPLAGAVGFVDHAVFTPLNDGEAKSQRLLNGITGSLSFAAMESVPVGLAAKQLFNSKLLDGGSKLALGGFAGGTTYNISDNLAHGKQVRGSEVVASGLEWAGGNLLIGGGAKALHTAFGRISSKPSSVETVETPVGEKPKTLMARLEAIKPTEADALPARPLDAVREVPRQLENPERFQLQRESELKDDVKTLYEKSFPAEERQPTDQIEELVKSGRIRIHTLRNKETQELESLSFVSIHDESPMKFAHLDFVAVQGAKQSKGIGTKHMSDLHEAIRKENPEFVAMTLEMEDPKMAGLSKEDVADRKFRSKFYERLGATNTLPGATNLKGEHIPEYLIRDFNQIDKPATWIPIDDNQPAEFRAFVYKPAEYNARRAALTFYMDEGGYGLTAEHTAVLHLQENHRQIDEVRDEMRKVVARHFGRK